MAAAAAPIGIGLSIGGGVMRALGEKSAADGQASLARLQAEDARRAAREKALDFERASEASEFNADRIEVAAEGAAVKALQVEAAYDRELNRTLSNIMAIRASAGTDPFSATGVALMEAAGDEADRQQGIRRSNARLEQTSFEIDALQQRYAALLQKEAAGRAIDAGEREAQIQTFKASLMNKAGRTAMVGSLLSTFSGGVGSYFGKK